MTPVWYPVCIMHPCINQWQQKVVVKYRKYTERKETFKIKRDESDLCDEGGLTWCVCLCLKVTNIKTPQTQEDEFIEIQSDTGTAFQRWTVRHMTMLQQVSAQHLLHVEEQLRIQLKNRFTLCWFCLFFNLENVVGLCFSQVMANVMSLSAPELRLQGLLLVIVWFCLAFR